MLTQERADMLTSFISSDLERGSKLLSLDAEEALKQINAYGNDFTLSELAEYGKALKAEVEETKGELDPEALDGVAGGTLIATLPIIIGLPRIPTPFPSIPTTTW